jgi:hypothetical protein
MLDHKYASIKILRILAYKMVEVAVQKNCTYHTWSEFLIEPTRQQPTNSSEEQLTYTRSACFFIRSSHLFLPSFINSVFIRLFVQVSFLLLYRCDLLDDCKRFYAHQLCPAKTNESGNIFVHNYSCKYIKAVRL